MTMDVTAQNKAVVIRFNREFIEKGDMNAFTELVADDVVNHAAPSGTPNGPESMVNFILHILRAGFSNIKVDIYEQVAERDLVTSRKKITGIHTGSIFGIPASNKHVVIHVIDMIRIKNGKYAEHWGISNFSEVLAQIAAS